MLNPSFPAIPGYICVYHLVNVCLSNPAVTGSTCSNGLHPTLEDLLDLTHYETVHHEEITRFYGADGHRECSVCMERVLSKHLPKNRRFAILENCSHTFCAGCIVSWNEEESRGQGSVSCPICRKASGRIVYLRMFVNDNATLKEDLFYNLFEC